MQDEIEIDQIVSDVFDVVEKADTAYYETAAFMGENKKKFYREHSVKQFEAEFDKFEYRLIDIYINLIKFNNPPFVIDNHVSLKKELIKNYGLDKKSIPELNLIKEDHLKKYNDFLVLKNEMIKYIAEKLPRT
jgi:hypothetical protein